MKININDVVAVRLTRMGVKTLVNSDRDDLWDSVDTVDMRLEAQLHELMAVFGPGMYVGMPGAPFVNNTIELARVGADSTDGALKDADAAAQG